MGELWKDVCLCCGCWEARDVELAGVGGLYFRFVGLLDVDAVVCGDLIAAGIVDVKKVPYRQWLVDLGMVEYGRIDCFQY
jgi:hypothetical protein